MGRAHDATLRARLAAVRRPGVLVAAGGVVAAVAAGVALAAPWSGAGGPARGAGADRATASGGRGGQAVATGVRVRPQSHPSRRHHGHHAAGRPRGAPGHAETARRAVGTTTTTGGPLRVLEIGDSLGVDLGDAMQSQWVSGGAVTVAADARGDTGLANTGYYDWPAALAADLQAVHPQLVVVFLGANDSQGLYAGGTAEAFGSPGWQAAYAGRVQSIVSESVAAGAKVLWIGEPAMQSPALDAAMTMIDGLAAGVVARYPEAAAYLDANTVLAPGGTFTFTGPAPGGGTAPTRTPDGVHLTPDGAGLLASAAAQTADARWHLSIP